jgi:hypothetical protein
MDFWTQEYHGKTNFQITSLERKLRGFGPRANYTDRATAAFWRSSTNFCG